MDTFKRVRNRACKSRCLGKNGYKRAVWSRVLLGKISNVPCTSCFQPSGHDVSAHWSQGGVFPRQHPTPCHRPVHCHVLINFTVPFLFASLCALHLSPVTLQSFQVKAVAVGRTQITVTDYCLDPLISAAADVSVIEIGNIHLKVRAPPCGCSCRRAALPGNSARGLQELASALR